MSVFRIDTGIANSSKFVDLLRMQEKVENSKNSVSAAAKNSSSLPALTESSLDPLGKLLLLSPHSSKKGAAESIESQLPCSATQPSSNWSHNVTKSGQLRFPQSPSRSLAHRSSAKARNSHQSTNRLELPRYDPRFPGLLMEASRRSISIHQLDDEGKAIYSSLTMVENKCIHITRARAVAAHESSKPNDVLALGHWKALIEHQCWLLDEHHDFFLASQHPSASPLFRRSAAIHHMPVRMWNHAIHHFLELLERHRPESTEYMLGFIHSAYRMIGLLYETVPAFENTWIECLGDLGRYRMVIECEDDCVRETWANVARSWYTKAADRNPTVGRLYHHLAILARPNALQQLYLYSRSLTCDKPFSIARETILTLLDPILKRAVTTYPHALPIYTRFIKAHAILFERLAVADFKQATAGFQNDLDEHIGRATAEWKEQGMYIAIINISSWFDYGVGNNALRQVFLTEIVKKPKISPPAEGQLRTASPADQQDPALPSVPENELVSTVNALRSQALFSAAKGFTYETFAMVLRRIGDKNVLPHIDIMLTFLTTLAAASNINSLLVEAPWPDLVACLNALVKTEPQIQNPSEPQNVPQPQDIDTLFATPVFPDDGERSDELPLPEDYLVRGLICAHDVFPKKWFERELDEEERHLELASTIKIRMERVLRLGYKLATYSNWIAYDGETHTFRVLPKT